MYIHVYYTFIYSHTLTAFRWWPCEVILPNSIPDNIVSKKPGDGMFVVRFCGSQDFAWTYHGRIVPYTENFDIGQKPHRKPKAADAAFKKGKINVDLALCGILPLELV
jgi:hypothetical protein